MSKYPFLTPLLDHLEMFINNCFGRQKENYKTIIVGALTNISLYFKKVDRLGVIGQNGLGKTTLLHV